MTASDIVNLLTLTAMSLMFGIIVAITFIALVMQ